MTVDVIQPIQDDAQVVIFKDDVKVPTETPKVLADHTVEDGPLYKPHCIEIYIYIYIFLGKFFLEIILRKKEKK